jgi:hypothetical protein
MNLEFHTFEGNVEHLKTFDQHYQPQKHYWPPMGNKRPKRKSKAEMLCRFCGKGNAETTFKSKPHVISRLFGNNFGISDFECDRCNNYFSAFESDTANFLGLQRSFFALGRQSIPVFKAADGSIEARKGDIFGVDALEISAIKPGFITNNTDKGEIEFNITNNSYTPLNVYKCLLKIALTIIPESEFNKYDYCLRFLMAGEKSEQFANHAKNIHKGHSGFETINPYAFLFKKRDSKSKLPTHWFKLYYLNSYIQFHLPYNSDDSVLEIGESISIPLCPPLIVGNILREGTAKQPDSIDLSSSEKKIGETNKFHLNFDKEDLLKSAPIDLLTDDHEGQNFDSSSITKVFLARYHPDISHQFQTKEDEDKGNT